MAGRSGNRISSDNIFVAIDPRNFKSYDSGSYGHIVGTDPSKHKPLFWLKAKSAESFDITGSGAINDWYDSSGNNHSASKVSGGDLTWDGSGSVYFNGTNDAMINSSKPTGSEATVFLVAEWLDLTTYNHVFADGNTLNSVIISGYADSTVIIIGNNGSQLNTIKSISTGSRSFLTSNYTDGSDFNRINFSQENTSALTYTRSVGYLLGKWYNNTGFFNGRIREIIYFDRTLPTQDIISIENYLNIEHQGNTKTIVTDLVKPNREIRLLNGVGYSDGYFTFDGTDDQISFGSIDEPVGSFSIEIWAQSTDGSNTKNIVTNWQNGNNAWTLARYRSGSTQRYDWALTGNGTLSYSLSASTGIRSTFNHIVCVFDTDTDSGYIYVNGKLANSVEGTWTSTPTAGGFVNIGGVNGTSFNEWAGNIGQFVYHTTALTPKEIYNSWNSKKELYT